MLHRQSVLPPLGLDADRYWNEEMYQDINRTIQSLGLDRNGSEGYCFVAPRHDIPAELSSTMMGNHSYAGDIPGLTPGYSSAVIVRDLLYPALIWQTPIEISPRHKMINYRVAARIGGGHRRSWVYLPCDERYFTFTFQNLRRSLSLGGVIAAVESRGKRHGVHWPSHGGSGYQGNIFRQIIQLSGSDLVDGWRGYMYDNWKTPRSNGMVWYNPEPPMLYDIIHYKWVDTATGESSM